MCPIIVSFNQNIVPHGVLEADHPLVCGWGANIQAVRLGLIAKAPTIPPPGLPELVNPGGGRKLGARV